MRAVVRGRVQGVGFRAFVVREAASRHITGFVRNLREADAVEVVACGDETAVQELVLRLGTGPSGAHVASITTHDIEPTPGYPDFSVRY